MIVALESEFYVMGRSVHCSALVGEVTAIAGRLLENNDAIEGIPYMQSHINSVLFT